MIRPLLLSVLLVFLHTACIFLRPDYHPKVSDNSYTVRTGDQVRQLKPISAHRGGRAIPEYPENALETFDYVFQKADVMIECDVQMSQDSVLYLMHDGTLDRTTTGTGPVIGQSWETLSQLHLKDDFDQLTSFKIPQLKDVLKWADGRTLLTLDIKRGVPFEYVLEEIHKVGAQDDILIITYSLEDAQTVYKLDPNMLMSVSIRSEEVLERYLTAGIPPANMVAFTGTSEPSETTYRRLHEEGMLCILGTLGNLDKRVAARTGNLYIDYLKKGADILATDRPIEAAMAIKGTNLRQIPKK